MKTEHLKSAFPENKQRGSVALLFFVFLTLVVFIPGAAQLRSPRRVTGIQLGGAAEGSRVTVVSDSALNDYEAFRRGDRFYVKIPLADFNSATPHFRADGFEDVQVQKVGDSLIVSFKLQPGATARVDQRGTRLDVIFSAPNRGSYNNSAAAGSTRTVSPQTSVDRGHDTAGPVPQDSASTFRNRVIAERAAPVNESRRPGDPRWQTSPRMDSNKNANKAGNKSLTTTSGPVAAPSPKPSPSSILSPRTPNIYPPLTSSTPAAAASATPLAGSSGSTAFLNWRTRQAAARRWMAANRLATLLGVLIFVSMIVYLASAIRRRQASVVKTKQTKVPKVQPKYSPGSELNELPSVAVNKQPSSIASAATAPAVEHSWTGPTILSANAGQGEPSSEAEEEEREVFEL
jgi:hypothetical protein